MITNGSLQSYFNQSIVVFLAGVIFSAASDIILEGGFNIYFGIIAITVSLAILYAVTIFCSVQNDINTQLNQIGLVSLWMTEQSETNEGFIKSRDISLSAKHSILVLSHHVPEEVDMQYTSSRKNYLADGIEKAIKLRLSHPDAPAITYRRIIQSDKIDEVQGVLHSSIMKGDRQTFDHCSNIFNMMEGKMYSNVMVDFRVCRPIPSFPSTLIVDDKYVLIALSARAPKLATPDNKYAIVGVLLIEDRDGKTVQGFKNIFTRFYENSDSIHTIVDAGRATS